MVVLAICEGVSGTARVLGVLLPLLVLAGWFMTLRMLVRTAEPEVKASVFLTFLLCIAIGGVFFLVPGGASAPGANYLDRFWTGAAVSVGVGAIASLMPGGAGFVRLLVTAVLGAVTLPGFLVGLLVFALSLSGSCLD